MDFNEQVRDVKKAMKEAYLNRWIFLNDI
jgi:hypothetical protein